MQQEEYKLKKAVQMMSNEYENNAKLTEFTALDSEDFLTSNKKPLHRGFFKSNAVERKKTKQNYI
ncbi:hypothetical protein SPONL_1800 [uncultured Candidatus Thioglobus sp.]|nr:hypothetical protein SPONL_1800 [uncultured Candidatus Thioglobus sp.]